MKQPNEFRVPAPLMRKLEEIVQLWTRLAHLILSGDKHALDRWIVEAYNTLLAIAAACCYWRYGDESLAPEVVELAFRRILERMRSGRGMPRTPGFLLGAIRLAAGEIYRKENRRKNKNVALDGNDDDDLGLVNLLRGGDSIIDELYLAEFWEWADSALPTQDRQILEEYLAGTSQQEIADKLGISRDRVRRTIIDITQRYLKSWADEYLHGLNRRVFDMKVQGKSIETIANELQIPEKEVECILEEISHSFQERQPVERDLAQRNR